jgi:hypothetical protein
MTSPAYQTVSHSSGTSTSFTATEPTGTASGDQLLLRVFLDTNPGGWTPPTGWTEKIPVGGSAGGTTVTDGTNTFQAYYYAIERGASAPALNASWTGSHYFEWTITRITGGLTGGSAAFVESITGTTPGAGTTCNSPSATPLTANTLVFSDAWCWAGFGGSESLPSGYSLVQQTAFLGNCQAQKQLTAQTAEDPTAWGALGSSTAIWATTVIIASVAPGGPTISSQPASQQVASGATATFSITASASGGGTLSYQWKLNGTNVSTGSGGTTASYTTAAVALSDSGGVYTCDVTETGGTNAGTTTSAAANLIVGIALVASSTAVYTATGTPTAILPAWPTTAILSGSAGKVVLVIGMKPATSGAGSVTTPGSWTLLGSIQAAGGYTAGGASAADTGNCDLYVYAIDDPGTVTGTLSVTVNVGATNGVAWAKMFRYSAPAGSTFSLAMATGSDTSAGNVSITFGSDPGVTAGDRILGAMCIPTDVTTPAQFSAEAFSQTGVTFGTVTELEEPDSANNFDIGGFAVDALATAGTSSAAPVLTATAGGTTTNVRGPGVFVRLRASSSGVSGTGSAAEQSFAASGSGAEAFSGSASAAASSFAASGAGVEKFTASAAAAESPFAVSAAGSVANFNGPATASASPFAAAAAGILAFIATGTAALSSFGASSAGSEAFSGSCTASASPFGTTASGTEKYTGSASAALSPFTCSATGGETFSCSGSAALSPLAVTAAGALAFAGTSSAAVSQFDASGGGAEAFTGTSAAACSTFAVAGVGAVGNGINGAAACSVSQFAASAAGLEKFTGAAAASTSPFGSTCAGTELCTGSAAAACQPFASTATGATGNLVTGAAAAALRSFATSSAGLETFTGAVVVACSTFASSSSGAERFAGACAGAFSPFSASGVGTFSQPIFGACTVALAPFNCSGIGGGVPAGSMVSHGAVTVVPLYATAEVQTVRLYAEPDEAVTAIRLHTSASVEVVAE